MRAVAACPRENHSAHWEDQPGVLEHGNELVGTDLLADWPGPPGKCFDRDNEYGGELDDRLVDGVERLVADPDPAFLFEFQAALCCRGHVSVEKHVSIAALAA